MLQAACAYAGSGTLCETISQVEVPCFAVEFLPLEGVTIVTGRGLETGCKTFKAVGELLVGLVNTVVARYAPNDKCGAYTVWVLCPDEARRR